jgi:hypothetical protein
MIKKHLKGLGLVVVVALVQLGVAVQPAQAQPVSLASLLMPGATLTSGKMVFSEFQITQNIILSGAGAGGMWVNPAAVFVNPTTDPQGNDAISIVGGFIVSNGQTADFAFNYRVTTNNMDPITDLHAGMVGSAIGGAGNFALLAEVVVGTVDDLLIGIGFTPVPIPNSAKLDLTTPAVSIQVAKDLFASSTAGGLTFVSDITQGFSKVVIPEPSSIALMGIGVLGLLGFGWRRRQARAKKV